MVARCAVPFLCDLKVERNFFKPARPGGRKNIYSPFHPRPVSWKSHAKFWFIFRSKVQKANISFLAKQTRVCDSVV